MGNREKVEWLNAVLTSVWPHVDATISDIVEGLVEPLLAEKMRKSGVRGVTLGFAEFTLGTTAPRVEAVEVEGAAIDTLSVTCNVKWKGDPDIVFSVSGAAIYGGLSALTVEIRDLVVSGNMQVHLSLMPAPPLVAGVRIMFTENPFLSYDVGVKVTPGLPPLKLDVVPGLNTLLKNIIGDILRDKIVFPTAVAVPVADLLGVFDKVPGYRPGGSASLSLSRMGDAGGNTHSSGAEEESEDDYDEDVEEAVEFISKNVIKSASANGARGSVSPSASADPTPLEDHLRLSPEGYLTVEVVEARNLTGTDARADGSVLVGLIAEGNVETISERRRTSESAGVGGKSDSRSFFRSGTSAATLTWHEKLPRIPILSRQLQQLHVRLTTSAGVAGGRSLVGHATQSLANLGTSSLTHIDAWLPLVKGSLRRSTSGSDAAAGRPALRVVVRWEELREDEVVRVPHHPFWMGHAPPTPPKTAVAFFKRVSGDLELSAAHRAWAAEMVGDGGGLGGEVCGDVDGAAATKGTRSAVADVLHNLPPERLPRYLQVPFWHRAQWINAVIAGLWPHINTLASRAVSLVNKFRIVGIPGVGYVHVDNFHLGLLPLVGVAALRVACTEQVIHLDVDISLAGDFEAAASLRSRLMPFCPVGVEISDVSVSVLARLAVQPLFPALPLVGGVSLSLLSAPEIDLSCRLKLSPLLPSLNLGSIPGFLLGMSAGMRALKPVISHPAAVDIPLVDFNHPSVAAVLGSHLQAAGLLYVDVLECEGLVARDSGGTSDPYVAVSVLDVRARARHANDMNDFRQRCHRTAVVRRTLSPRWADPSLGSGGAASEAPEENASGIDGVAVSDDGDAETASFAWVVGDAAGCVITVSVFDEDFNFFKLKSPALARVAAMGVLSRIKPLVNRAARLSKPPARVGLNVHWSEPVKAMMANMQEMGTRIGDIVTTMIEVEGLQCPSRAPVPSGPLDTERTVSSRRASVTAVDADVPSCASGAASTKRLASENSVKMMKSLLRNLPNKEDSHSRTAFRSIMKQKSSAAMDRLRAAGKETFSHLTPSKLKITRAMSPMRDKDAAAAEDKGGRKDIVVDIQHMIRAEAGVNRNDFLGATVLQIADCVASSDESGVDGAAGDGGSVTTGEVPAAVTLPRASSGADLASGPGTGETTASLEDMWHREGNRKLLKKQEDAAKALMTGVGVEFWTPLVGVKSGRIKLRVRLEPFQEDGAALGQSPGCGGDGSVNLHRRGTLIVSLRRAHGLYNRHARKFLDPQVRPMAFVTLTAGGLTRVSRRSPGTNAEFWQDFQFPNIDPITDATGALEVVVWDNLRVVFHKPIGELRVKLADVVKAGCLEDKFRLERAPQGELELMLTWRTQMASEVRTSHPRLEPRPGGEGTDAVSARHSRG